MFNLEKEVNKWSESVQGIGCGNSERKAELQDHLYCEIDRLQEQGLSAEQAFLKATEKMGNTDDLGVEYAKNKSLLAKLHDAEMAHFERVESKYNLSPRQTAILTIGHSLLFAAAMIISSLLIQDGKTSSMVLFTILLPLWFTTYLFLPGVRHSVSCEWKAIKRVFGN